MALTVGLSIAAALLALLAVPVHLHVAVARDQAVEARVRISWLFGLVSSSVLPRTSRARRPKKQRPVGRRVKRVARNARRVAGGVLRPDLRARAIEFLRDVLKAVRPRDVRLHACIGLDDPADTGRLWGLCGSLVALFPSRDVRLEPDFDGTCFRFEATARVRVIPVQLLYLTSVFLVSPPVVRAFVAR